MAASGVTVFVTTHYLDEAEYCHRLALIHAGQLAALGGVDELKQVFAGHAVLEVACARVRPTRSTRWPTRPGRARSRSSARACTWWWRTRRAGGGRVEDALRRGGQRCRPTWSGSCRRSRTCSSTTWRRRRPRGAGPRAMRKTWAVARKELRQIARDPLSLIMLVGLPAFMLVLYGFALNFDVRHVALAVQDQDGTRASRDLLSRVRQLDVLRRDGRGRGGRRPGAHHALAARPRPCW